MNCYTRLVSASDTACLYVRNETYLIFAVDSISSTDAGSTTGTIEITPVSTLLPIGAITSHVARVSTDAADDVRCGIRLLWTIVFSMPDLATVLAGLVFVVTQGTV